MKQTEEHTVLIHYNSTYIHQLSFCGQLDLLEAHLIGAGTVLAPQLHAAGGCGRGGGGGGRPVPLALLWSR